MTPRKLKNFRLPLDLCEALESDGRSQTAIVIKALRAELSLEVPSGPVAPSAQAAPSITPRGVSPEVGRESSVTLRAEELARTLPPATAQRIAELEARR